MTDRIKRVRDYHVYTQSGRRLLDLALDDGGAVFGHRSSGIQAGFKRVIDRGSSVGLENRETSRARGRLQQWWQELFLEQGFDWPDWGLQYLPPGSRSYVDLIFAGQEISILDIWDDYSQEQLDEALQSPLVLLVRPGWEYSAVKARLKDFLDQLIPNGKVWGVMPVLPISAGITAQPLFLNPMAASPATAADLPGELACYGMRAGVERFFCPQLPAVSQKRSDYIWFPPAFSRMGWQQWRGVGIYQFWQGSGEQYQELGQLALDIGIVLPGSPGQPVITPAVLSKTESKLLDRLWRVSAGQQE